MYNSSLTGIVMLVVIIRKNRRHADKCQDTELSNSFVYLLYGKTKGFKRRPARDVHGMRAVSPAPFHGGILCNR